MKVLVTGAAGKLGAATCRVLIDAGIEVVATDRRADASLPFHIRVADLLNREICYELADGVDAVVQLGNHPHQHAGDAQRVFGENCAMNMNVFEAAYDRGVRKIVFASSIQAMTGERPFRDGEFAPSSLPYLPLDGDVPANPGNHYAASKAAAEMLLQYFARYRQISAVAIRFPMLWKSETFSTYRHPMEIARNSGNLDEAFSLLSLTDAGRLVLAILNATLPGYRVYLPAARLPWIKAPFAEIIERFYEGVTLRKEKAEIDSLIDISQITRDTGWVPRDTQVD
jgi:nucleoside-diphosphate-sugar epimerase